jgi:hypothetical protein
VILALMSYLGYERLGSIALRGLAALRIATSDPRILGHLAGLNPSRVWLLNTVELYGNHVGAKGERH